MLVVRPDDTSIGDLADVRHEMRQKTGVGLLSSDESFGHSCGAAAGITSARERGDSVWTRHVPCRFTRTLYRWQRQATFLCDNSGILLAFERCRSSHFGVLLKFVIFNRLARGIKHTTTGFPLSSMRATARTSAEQYTKTCDTSFGRPVQMICTESIEHFLKPPALSHGWFER